MAALVVVAFAASGAVLSPYTLSGEHSLTLLVEHPGIEAGEIERSITLTLENAAAGLSGVTEMLSHSRDGAGQVQLIYRRGHDLEAAYEELRAMAEAVEPALPAASRTPQILRAGGSEMRSPVFIVAFPDSTESTSVSEAAVGQSGSRTHGVSHLSNDELRARYAAVDQVALVEVAGREPEEILIRYRASEVSNNEVFGAAAMTQRLSEFSRSLAVRLQGGAALVVGQRYDSAAAVAMTPLGDLHSIGRLTSVTTLPRRAERVTQLNGSRGALVYVMATADADLIRLSRELRQVGHTLVKELKHQDPAQGLLAEPLVLHDLGKEVRATLFALVAQVLLGAGAVVLLMVLFLHTGTSTWVVLPAVGFACLTPVALLSVLDITLDATILGAVALAAGLAADGSAVVLEFELHTLKRMGLGPGKGPRKLPRKGPRKDPRKLPRKGPRKGPRKLVVPRNRPYTTALFFSFLSTVVVFLPLYYAEPAFRKAYGWFAVALCTGLFAATLYATCIMPQLLGNARATPPAKVRPRSLSVSAALVALESRVSQHRPLVLVLCCLTIAGAGVRVLNLEYRTEAQVDPGATTAVVEFAAGTTVEAVVTRAREYEAQILPVLGTGSELLTRSEAARLRMEFIGVDQALAAQVRAVIESERRDGETLYFPGELSSRAGFEVRLGGPDRAVLHSLVLQAAALLAAEPATEALYFRFREAAPVVEITPLSPALRAAGLSTRELASQLYHALGTGIAGKWYSHAGERDIRVQSEPLPLSTQDLQNLPVFTPAGGVVELGTVAAFHSVAGVDGRQRRNRVPTLGLTVLGQDLKAPQLREVMGSLPLGNGYFIDVEAVLGETQPPFAVAAAAVVLVFLVVLTACNHLGAAAWAAAPAPVCLVLSLALLSIGSGKGTVELQSLLAAVLGLGISVNFSLLYLLTLPSVKSQAPEPDVPLLADTGLEAKARIYRACIPATLTTIVAVLPALLGLGGSALLRPLSLGICVSSVVSLLVLPIWAGLFDPGQKTRRRV